MKTVLLVEDNEMNRDMLSRRLERMGYKVLIASDGEQGQIVAEKILPDIVLMDMSLPVIDGWTATRMLKISVMTRQIPIIGLSAHAMSGDREKAFAAGCDEYETKPLDLSALVSKIEMLTDNNSEGKPGK